MQQKFCPSMTVRGRQTPWGEYLAWKVYRTSPAKREPFLVPCINQRSFRNAFCDDLEELFKGADYHIIYSSSLIQLIQSILYLIAKFHCAKFHSVMDSFSLYNGYNSTVLYLPPQALTPKTHTSAPPFEDWIASHDGEHPDDSAYEHAVLEKRVETQPNWPLLTLPLKKSVHALPANHTQDGHSRVHAPPSSTLKYTEDASTQPSRCISSSDKSGEEPHTATSPTMTSTHWDHDHDTSPFDHSKSLLSPIKFSPPSGPKTQNEVSVHTNRKTSESSTYMFYPPRNPADNHPLIKKIQPSVPQRKLSYGEPSLTPKPKSLHRITGSLELRREASRKPDGDNCESWLERGLEASANRPYYSEPTRSKPKLWLDLAEEGERIEEAVCIQSHVAVNDIC